MKAILFAMIQLAGMQFVVALSGLLRNKVLAVKLGPEGYGAYAQLMAVTMVIYTIVKCGLAVGLSRSIASSKSQAEKQKYLGVANLAVLLLSAVAWLAGGFLGQQFLVRTLGGLYDKNVELGFWVLLLVAPIDGIQNNFMGFLQGEIDIKGLASKRSLGIVLATALGVPIIWLGGVWGAAVQAAAVSVYLAYLLGKRIRHLGYAPLNIHWARPVVISLATIGLASLVSGFVQNAADLVIRTNLIEQVGADQNGIYQAAISLSGQVMAIILGSVGSFSLATISKTRSLQEISEATNRILRVSLRVGALALGALGLMGRPLVALLFSPAFVTAVDFFAVLLISEYVRSLVWVVGAPLLAQGHVSTWLFLELLLAFVRWATTIMLLPSLGIAAVFAGYLISWSLHCVLNLAWFVAVMKLWIRRDVLQQFALGLACVSLLGYCGAKGHYLIGALVVLAYVLVAVRPNEWAAVARGVAGRRSA